MAAGQASFVLSGGDAAAREAAVVDALPRANVSLPPLEAGGVWCGCSFWVFWGVARRRRRERDGGNARVVRPRVSARASSEEKTRCIASLGRILRGKDRLCAAPRERCFDFGDDAGAANVVKLSGNFLIASAIEALAESLAQACQSPRNRARTRARAESRRRRSSEFGVGVGVFVSVRFERMRARSSSH